MTNFIVSFTLLLPRGCISLKVLSSGPEVLQVVVCFQVSLLYYPVHPPFNLPPSTTVFVAALLIPAVKFYCHPIKLPVIMRML